MTAGAVRGDRDPIVRDHRDEPDVRDYRGRDDVRDHRRPHRYHRPVEEYAPPRRDPRGPDRWSSELDAALNNPGLSIQDKLAFLFAKIAQQLDDDIDKKIKEIDKTQTGAGRNNGERGKAVDVETVELNRLVTKRKDFVEMFRTSIDKYNENVAKMHQSLEK